MMKLKLSKQTADVINKAVQVGFIADEITYRGRRKLFKIINSLESVCCCGMIDRLTADDFVCLNCGETTHYAPIPEANKEIAKGMIKEFISEKKSEKYTFSANSSALLMWIIRWLEKEEK